MVEEYRLVCNPNLQGSFSCQVDDWSCDEKDKAAQVQDLQRDANEAFSRNFTLAQAKSLAKNEGRLQVNLFNRVGTDRMDPYIQDDELFLPVASITDLGNIDDPAHKRRTIQLGGYLMCSIVTEVAPRPVEKATPTAADIVKQKEPESVAKPKPSVEEHLIMLKELLKKKLISPKDFKEQKTRILKEI